MNRNKIHIYRYENIMKPIIRENEYATTKLKNKVGIPIISFKNQKKFSFVIRGRQMIHIQMDTKIPFVNRWQRSLPVVQIHPNRDLIRALSDTSEHFYFPELMMNRLTWAWAISAISCVPHP